MDIKVFAELLAAAPMTDEEREHWVMSLPSIPQSALIALAKCLQDEQAALAKTREKYHGKIEKIVNKAKAKKLRAGM